MAEDSAVALAEPNWRRYEPWIVAGLTLVAAVLRIVHLGTEPLWQDEALTLRFAQLPVIDLLRDLAEIDVHPPLYYLLLKVWILTGTSEVHIRLLSLVFSTLTVPLLYATGRALGSRWAGAVAALLFATSALQVQYAQEARSYALVTFATTLALWALARLFAGGAAATSRFGAALRGRGRWRDELPWWVYVGATALALHLHSIAVFLPAAATGVAAVWWATEGRFDRRFLVSWVAANTVVLLLWLPWLPFLFTQTVDVLADTWMETPSRRSAQRILARAWAPAPGGLPLLYALAALALFGAWSWRRRPFAAVLTLAVSGGVPFLLYAVSRWRPVFIERSLIWPHPAFLLLLGAGCVALRPRVLAPLALAGLLAVQSLSLARYYDEPRKEPWDRAAAYVDARLEPHDLVVFHPADAEMGFRYYFRHALDEVPMLGVVARGPAWRRRVDEIDVVTLDELRRVLPRYDRIWLVRRHARVPGGNEVEAALTGAAREVTSKRILNLEIVLFVERGDARRAGGSAAPASGEPEHPEADQ